MNKILRLLFFLLLLSSCKEPDVKEIHYYDGSNNHYSYIQTTGVLKYEPVTPSESSSGIYSGGVPVQITLSESDRQQWEELVTKGLNSPNDYMEKREMMTGLIRVEYTDRRVLVILQSRSESKQSIEAFLSEHLK